MVVSVIFYETVTTGQVVGAKISYDGTQYTCEGNKNYLGALPLESEDSKVIIAAMKDMPRQYTGDYLRAECISGEKGGEGSGHYGHTGRPGQVGGSALSFPGGVSRAYARKRAREITYMRSSARSQGGLKKGKASKEEVDWAVAQLRRHPKKVVDSLTKITICRDDNAYEQLCLRNGLNSGDSAAFYIRDGAEIVLRSLKPTTFDHEMGHHLARSVSGAADTFLYTWLLDPGFDRYTWYSKRSPHEGFAESYMAFLYFKNTGGMEGLPRRNLGMSNFEMSSGIKRTFDAVQEAIDWLKP